MDNQQHLNGFLFSIFEVHDPDDKTTRNEIRARTLHNDVLRAGLLFDKSINNKQSRINKKRKKYLKRLPSTPSLTSIREDENEESEANNFDNDSTDVEDDMDELIRWSQIDLHVPPKSDENVALDLPKRPHSVNLPPLNSSTTCLQWKQAILIGDEKPGRTSLSTPLLPIRTDVPYMLAPLELTHPRAERQNRQATSKSKPKQKPKAVTVDKPDYFPPPKTLRPWKTVLKKLVTDLLNERLADVQYEPQACAILTQKLAKELIESVKKTTSESYKVVSLVSLGSLSQENCIQFSSRAYWDQDCDYLTIVNYKNESLYAAVLVYVFSIYRNSKEDVSAS